MLSSPLATPKPKTHIKYQFSPLLMCLPIFVSFPPKNVSELIKIINNNN